ncbi:hypothetical protein HAX54_039734 [Datura stramonium]|uniref:Uncharacterized protein n=1 Tax=Datura stramonium TaxID=4076 RepID=A0ABS8VPN0_DATST|nr:hypothetical protein [Datura stramonium]
MRNNNHIAPAAKAVALSVMEEAHASKFVLPLSISQDVTQIGSSETSSLHLPHHMFGDSSNQRSLGLVEQVDDIQLCCPKDGNSQD